LRQKNRQKINGAFVPIMKEMISSPAFLNLTNASRVAYLLLKAQCSKFNQEEVQFPFSDACRYMNRNTFSRSIQELQEGGFIEKSSFGGLYRRTNVYRFSQLWKQKREE
jgi:hypothetical protein